MNQLQLKAQENRLVAVYCENSEYYDVAVSRYYYYIFENLKSYIDNEKGVKSAFEQYCIENKITILENEPASHKVRIDFIIKYFEKPERRIIGLNTNLNYLHKLRKSRNKSDYDYAKIQNFRDFRVLFKEKFEVVERTFKQLNIVS